MAHDVPFFWENSLERIKEVSEGVRAGKSRVLGSSCGGRPIVLIEYGEKQDFHRLANYSSACAYHDTSVYADKTGAKPVLLIVGATHGGEIEGISAILNLVSALETGKDFAGREQTWVRDLKEQYRILLIPCMNPDGRARVPFSSVSQVSEHDVVYYKHGQWKDGTLSDYTVGFRIHPIINDVSYLGGYYNDGGVNLSVDNFFRPMAVENKALIALVDDEAPDMTLLLHTGCHMHGKLMQPNYVPGYMMERVLELDSLLAGRFAERGFGYYTLEEHGIVSVDRMVYPPKTFGMPSAIHHVCGGFCAVYESYEATHVEEDPYSFANMLDCHFILFEQAFRLASRQLKN